MGLIYTVWLQRVLISIEIMPRWEICVITISVSEVRHQDVKQVKLLLDVALTSSVLMKSRAMSDNIWTHLNKKSDINETGLDEFNNYITTKYWSILQPFPFSFNMSSIMSINKQKPCTCSDSFISSFHFCNIWYYFHVCMKENECC